MNSKIIIHFHHYNLYVQNINKKYLISVSLLLCPIIFQSYLHISTYRIELVVILIIRNYIDSTSTTNRLQNNS